MTNGNDGENGVITNGNDGEKGATTNGADWEKGATANGGDWDIFGGKENQIPDGVASGDAKYAGGDARLHQSKNDFDFNGGTVKDGGDGSCRK